MRVVARRQALDEEGSGCGPGPSADQDGRALGPRRRAALEEELALPAAPGIHDVRPALSQAAALAPGRTLPVMGGMRMRPRLAAYL
jgi:hypothetical protein